VASPPPPKLTNVDLYRLFAPLIFADGAAESKKTRQKNAGRKKKERSLQDLYFSVRRFFVSLQRFSNDQISRSLTVAVPLPRA